MNHAHRDGGTAGLGKPGARISTGPSRAFTAIDGDVIFILLEGTLSPSEQALLERGEEELVMESRSAYQRAMREEPTELVEAQST